MTLVRAACLAALLAACSSSVVPSDAPAVDDGVPGAIEIGTGLATFVLLGSSMDELELVHGPQGGYHVYLSMRVSGVTPSSFGWRVTRTSDEHPLAYFTLASGPRSFVAVDGLLERVGELVILDTAEPSAVLGSVRVEATVTDGSGAEVHAVAMALIVDREP